MVIIITSGTPCLVLCAGFLVLLCTDLINSTKKKRNFHNIPNKWNVILKLWDDFSLTHRRDNI